MESIQTAAARSAQSIGSDKPQPRELPKAIIDRVWLRMTGLYGHKWTSNYGTSDADGTWAKGLADMSSEDLKRGFFACLVSEDDWPPSLPGFRKLCKPKRENAAMYRYSPMQIEYKRTDEEKAQGRARIAEMKSQLGA